MSRELLRRLPAVDAWLASEQGSLLCAEYSRPEVVHVFRERLALVRSELEAGGSELPDFSSETYTNLLRAELMHRRNGSLKPVVNATGIVLHTNLGRAPLAEAAIDAIAAVARGYSNLEYELETGSRGSRMAHAESLLCELTGAQSALVVNNCAAAVLLALRVLADSAEVVVSRGELIEIGGSFRMPDVIAQSGARMVEVGTTNRTTLADYEQALTDATRVLLMSHPSNYRVVGFTAGPTRHELASLARERDLVMLHDLGSGSLVGLDAFGMDEPTVAACVADGADIVAFSGDKLLGGPQAGIMVGRAASIERLRRHPLARAMRIDKLSLAALVATLRLYQPPNDPLEQVPVLRMITQSPEALGRRASHVARQLGNIEGLNASVTDSVGYAGGGSLPMSELPSRVIRIDANGIDAAELATRLRCLERPVIGRISKNALILDLRTVLSSQTDSLVNGLRAALS